ncbi:MAG TPA: AAA family ATPase [Ramlibacter sp.]|uniref:trifunctional serine/threonine-protein kinase/ATP-binding protein/sensor histidine kinase n=1 Tax=Ramlibacter sp. TaxID=1917967 RepID=UPI002BE59417|nr:AAA family ATPase [Ramlibacter sp.]HVZ45077.1 AAA family ATPase [Ramlibacter sp.]
MPVRNPKEVETTRARGAAAPDCLHESATTRVLRFVDASGASLVCKEYLGAGAIRRFTHERDMLSRLAGIEGVVQLAAVSPRADLLPMRDAGADTLAERLRAGPLETDALVALALRLASTLAAVHRAGVVHCDIHPANVLLAATQDAVLIDFDRSVTADRETSPPHEPPLAHTLAYLAPEQTGRTGRAVDQRTDLYALGATLYEAATGRLPFDATDALQAIHDHLVREPLAPRRLDPRVPAALSDIIVRLLAKAPERRYQSAEGLLADLRRLQDEPRPADGAFALGERDFPARLAAPKELVAREREVAWLESALEDAISTARRALLVEGAAGVGKSVLADRLKPLAAARGGWFVYGKFDQYHRDAATGGAVVQALRALGRLLLAEPKEALGELQQRVLARLGLGAGLIAQLPEFALLLGAQPALPAIDPVHAEERLLQATLDLLDAVASASRPLAIVLDDLQWASPTSLRTFEGVMTEPRARGLLIVGTYRGSEIEPAHPLARMLPRWRELPAPPREIELRNLDEAAQRELIARILRMTPQAAGELADAVGALAAGNPFETVEMLNALRAEGLLRMGGRGWAGWEWDATAIRRFAGRASVVDLLAERIGRLPPASRDLLECMSCLGGMVELGVLKVAAGLDEASLQQRLGPAFDAGLLVVQADDAATVHFRHDRVQQAVLATLDASQRQRLHLNMARRLARSPEFTLHMTQQYLGSTRLLTDAAECRRAAKLFHALARQLAAAANYALAESYLAASSELLAGLHDPSDAPLRDAVEADRYAALYSLGRMDEADAVYAIVAQRLGDPLALTPSARLQIRSLEFRFRSADAVRLGLALLARLGLDVPAAFTEADTARRLDDLTRWTREDKRADIAERAQASDARVLAAAGLLSRLQRSGAIVDPGVAAWLMRESLRLWTEHGPCAELVLSLCRIGPILMAARDDHRTGYEAARHVLEVGEARGFAADVHEARIVFAISASHWFEPIERAVQHVLHAREGMQGGDPLYVCFSYRVTIPALLDCAATLASVEADIEASHALSERTRNHHASTINLTERQLVRALTGGAPDLAQLADPPGEGNWPARVSSLPMALFNHHLRNALVFALAGDARSLAKHSAQAMLLRSAIPGYYTISHAWLFEALAAAWQLQARPLAQEADAVNRASLASRLRACSAWLAARAADQPMNFLHLARLVQAEEAWAAGEPWQAAAAFEAAMAEARDRPRPWHRALIVERAACFHLAHGLETTGQALMADACAQYEAWGASAKVDQLARRYPWLRMLEPAASARALRRSAAGDGPTTDSLDLIGVLRSSQALSSETNLERLAARVTDVLAALTGATQVRVFSWHDGEWWLLAAAREDQAVRPIAIREAARAGLAPLSALRYAERTAQPLLVDDATCDDRFARDAYFAGMHVCSLLVAPIASQGAVRAMLLLENRQGRAAFNAKRLDAVMLVAGQLAVSLANALLYENLEERVRSRTRELEHTQAQLVDTARRAGKAEIAANVLHNVGNILNSINVSASVVRRTIGESRSQGLAQAVDLLAEHARDLGRFFESDPRGKVFLQYLRGLVEALRTERQEALADLDRVIRSVEHISYVVATQQSHTGPSSLLETALPQALTEEALRMSAPALSRSGARVERRYEEVSPLPLDKPRLLQVLVNLITNAAQALQAVPESSRVLTLRTAIVSDEAGRRLLIAVEDAGEGISAENLKLLFAHGFTTRKEGHGFGLHSSALAAMEMGGRLVAHSDGPGRGAIFTLELPAGAR